ncbi:MAG TPA: hypothetical protein VOA64_08970 [Candidatus Dormibacteraeota bacterium]|nr:hypothetical protein [Candidatus Dormibacteraeota bacterium]
MARLMVQCAWVTKCNACGTCYTLPRFPVSNYIEGRPLVRPEEFDAQPLPCFCGHTFDADRNSLVYVIFAVLAVRRLGPDEFQVKRYFAESTTDLGPMSAIDLEAYLGSRSLIGILPDQVMDRLRLQPQVTIQMEASVVRTATA